MQSALGEEINKLHQQIEESEAEAFETMEHYEKQLEDMRHMLTTKSDEMDSLNTTVEGLQRSNAVFEEELRELRRENQRLKLKTETDAISSFREGLVFRGLVHTFLDNTEVTEQIDPFLDWKDASIETIKARFENLSGTSIEIEGFEQADGAETYETITLPPFAEAGGEGGIFLGDVAVKISHFSEGAFAEGMCMKLLNKHQEEEGLDYFPLVICAGKVAFPDLKTNWRPDAIVMERAKYGSPGKELSPQSIMYVFRRMLCGLQEMHDIGFVHRDVKLDNSLIMEDRRVLLADFGFCVHKSWGESAWDVGSDLYMSFWARNGESFEENGDYQSLGLAIASHFMHEDDNPFDPLVSPLLAEFYETNEREEKVALWIKMADLVEKELRSSPIAPFRHDVRDLICAGMVDNASMTAHDIINMDLFTMDLVIAPDFNDGQFSILHSMN